MGKRSFVTLIVLFVSHAFSFATFSQSERLVVHTDTETDYLYYLGDRSKSPTLTAQTNKLVLDLLPFPIQYELKPLKRTMKMMASGEKICALDKLVTDERREAYLFSTAMTVFLSRQLYQRLEINSLESDVVNLITLFEQNKSHRLLLTTQINYGETLEHQLARISKEQKVYRNSAGQAQGMIDMFIKGRAEYALFYPQQIKELGVVLAARSYAVKGISPYVTGHLMCSKGSENLLYIQGVNSHLKNLYRTGGLLNIHLTHVDSANQSRITRYFHRLIK